MNPEEDEEFAEEDEDFAEDEGALEEEAEEELPEQEQEQKPAHIIDIVSQSMNPVKNAPPIPEAMYSYGGEEEQLSAPEAANNGENVSGSEQQAKIDDMREMFYSKYMQKQLNSAEYQERVKAENSERS